MKKTLSLHISQQEGSKIPAMFRGYNPLDEIARWDMLIFCLGLELLLLNILLEQVISIAAQADTVVSLYTILGIALLGLCLCLTIIWIFWPGTSQNNFSRSMRERRLLREKLLQAVYTGEVVTCSILLTPDGAGTFILPISIASHLKKGSLWLAISTILCYLVLLAGASIIFYELFLPSWLNLLALVPSIITIFTGIVLVHSWLFQTSSHFLLPGLQIDENGITARYGQVSVTMRWSNIVYLGLTNGLPTIVNRKKYDGIYKCSEVFEISDGENVICWQAASSLRSHSLRLGGELTITPASYNAFSQGLAALVAERTGLPMYDFRGLERKSKRGDSGFGKREAR